ncbi:MAG: vitamin B12 dependent-methionine synthase activation domain-containing protein [Clostridia bacterium]|jgi:hypothetical protein
MESSVTNDLQFVSAPGWQVSFEELASRVRLDLCPDCEPDLRRLAQAAQPVARPRAAWRRADGIAVLDEERVAVSGIEFRSEMLAHNLEGSSCVWPYLASCGPELDALASRPDLATIFEDPLAEFWLDNIKALALDAAFEALRTAVLAQAGNDRLSTMNPGSGAVTLWPIHQQQPLFRLLGETAQEAVGVSLTDSCLMSPNKSVSGFFFHGAEDFDSCAYCERENCPGRRVPFVGMSTRY